MIYLLRAIFLQFIIYADDTTLFCSLNPRDFDKIENISYWHIGNSSLECI